MQLNYYYCDVLLTMLPALLYGTTSLHSRTTEPRNRSDIQIVETVLLNLLIFAKEINFFEKSACASPGKFLRRSIEDSACLIKLSYLDDRSFASVLAVNSVQFRVMLISMPSLFLFIKLNLSPLLGPTI